MPQLLVICCLQTLSGNVGGGLVTLGGGGGSAVVLVSSGLPVGSAGPSTMTSVGGVVYSNAPQVAGSLSAPASPALMLTKEVRLNVFYSHISLK